MIDPRNTWSDKKMYDMKALELANKFKDNFKKFKNVPEAIKEAGPEVKLIKIV